MLTSLCVKDVLEVESLPKALPDFTEGTFDLPHSVQPLAEVTKVLLVVGKLFLPLIGMWLLQMVGRVKSYQWQKGPNAFGSLPLC